MNHFLVTTLQQPNTCTFKIFIGHRIQLGSSYFELSQLSSKWKWRDLCTEKSRWFHNIIKKLNNAQLHRRQFYTEACILLPKIQLQKTVLPYHITKTYSAEHLSYLIHVSSWTHLLCNSSKELEAGQQIHLLAQNQNTLKHISCKTNRITTTVCLDDPWFSLKDQSLAEKEDSATAWWVKRPS